MKKAGFKNIITDNNNIYPTKGRKSSVSMKSKQPLVDVSDLLDNIREVYWRSNAQLKFTYVSPSIQQLTGYSQNELIGKTIFDLITPESRDSLTEVFFKNNALEEKGIRRLKNSYQIEFIHKQGNLIYLEIVSMPVYDSEGLLLNFHGIATDITPQILFEKHTKEFENNIIKMMDIMPFPVSIIEYPENNIIYANPSLSNILKIPNNELLGTKTSDFIVSGTDRRFLAELLDKGSVELEELLIRRSNGEPFWVLLSCTFIIFRQKRSILAGFIDINSGRNEKGAPEQKIFHELSANFRKKTNL